MNEVLDFSEKDVAKVYGDRILVKRIEVETSLIMPRNTSKLQKGIVVFVGNLAEGFSDIKKNDLVVFNIPTWDKSIKVGKDFLDIIESKDIILKLEGNNGK